MTKKIKLNKELGLLDIFTISTGAMFSSGFFLLPGIASQHTGPSVFLAYLVAGFLILPAMFSMAEISTAIPRSGGAYFFLDRSLGPLMGTIGGLGTYFALLFKTAFAIIGIGAYAAIFWDIPIKIIAITATIIFMFFNLVGAKKTSRLQNFLVLFLLIVLGLFIFNGIYKIFFTVEIALPHNHNHFTPFLTHGLDGFITTIGFVFVSYLGLTKIASIAEEIKNPERNIPLGMLLSLIVTTFIYVIGIFVMVAVIEPSNFAKDLAPAASAVKKIFNWMPGDLGTYIMVGAAMAAFASTGNAGLLSSSRYPFAMGRDKILPSKFSKVGKKGTPTIAILVTTVLILFFIFILSEEGIAKLASTFQLFIFILINFSVIVFRKSNIESYDPGYKSPLYPWMQITGIVLSLILIAYMGLSALLFAGFIILVAYVWYRYYVRENVQREGAIFHWFALLGKYQYPELEQEFMTILKEKGLRQGDPFDQTIMRARITNIKKDIKFTELVKRVSEVFSTEMHINKDRLIDEFHTITILEPALIIPEVSILYAKDENIDHPSLHIIFSKQGIIKPVSKKNIISEDYIKVFFFLVNPAKETRLQLRMLSRLIDIVERNNFISDITKLRSHRKIKEYLLYNDRYITVLLKKNTKQAEFIGKPLKEVKLHSDLLVALVERDCRSFAPHGNTILQENDTLTIIGEPHAITKLYNSFLN